MRRADLRPHLSTTTGDWFSERVGDLSTAEAGGRLAATLFMLCGTFVLVSAAIVPDARTPNRAGIALVGLGAVISGLVIWQIPWRRWPRSSTLYVVIPALSLIALHNVFTGADGYRYDVFFFATFVWIGLAHPPGTALKFSPALAAIYLTPAAFNSVSLSALLPGLAYVLPVCVLVGESAAGASERAQRSEAAMRASEMRFRSLVQHATDGIILVDRNGLTTYESPAVGAMLGYTAGERTGIPARELIADADADGLGRALESMGPDGVARFEIEVRHADGGWRWCDATLRNLLDVPAVASIVVNLSDITERKRATQALAEREASFRSLFSANPHPMWVYDRATLAFIEVNDAAVRHYGYSREEFLARRITDIRPPSDQVPFEQSVLADTEGRGEQARHRLADGREIEVEITAHHLEFRGRDAALVAVRDVTDRNVLDAQLRHQAFHDSLTGLANRALFADRIDHALRRRRPGADVGLLLIDLDGFKTINDSLGHAAGDELLVAVADRLRGAVRPGDTLARLGGDEFAVFIEELTTAASAALAAERILGALTPSFVVAGSELTIGASIGIAVPDDSMTSPGDLLRNADVAMYRAKAEGKNRHRLFQPVMHGVARERLELESDLRRAVEEGQFELHYQPVLALRTAQVVGCEALVRWNHPRRGLLGPDRFIGAAEESGVIVALGRWIIEKACRELAHLPIGISVNLSGRQMADPDLLRDITAAMESSGVRPGRLTLEITESVLMRNTDTAAACLHHLRSLGVRLSIDDFGTGYSSLSYLRTFKVDELKIDRSFIDSLPDDPQGLSLVEGIIRLATTLNLTTVAEGIERPAQQAILSSLGCDLAQGYHLGMPMAAAELMQFLELHHADVTASSTR